MAKVCNINFWIGNDLQNFSENSSILVWFLIPKSHVSTCAWLLRHCTKECQNLENSVFWLDWWLGSSLLCSALIIIREPPFWTKTQRKTTIFSYSNLFVSFFIHLPSNIPACLTNCNTYSVTICIVCLSFTIQNCQHCHCRCNITVYYT